MLSISPLKSASGAAKYYLSEENPKDLPDVSLEKDASDNYYLGFCAHFSEKSNVSLQPFIYKGWQGSLTL
ncbi:hypothetical protein [Vibrio harveyi]|uniref:hypothetical protein n=1 Tax=Vibrio harveyi TaxID=669 RepID=UPI0030F550D7